MKIIKPYFEIETECDGDAVLRKLEKHGRTAYKSEERITPDSARDFISNIMRRQPPHESILEHVAVSVRVITDRGVTHEIVRHRIASYTQESTRYCDYSNGKLNNEITVIKPCFWEEGMEAYNVWMLAMQMAEQDYIKLRKLGAAPQQARPILPNSLKTEIVITMNLREWRHFFKLPASDAHPQMLEITIPMLLNLPLL